MNSSSNVSTHSFISNVKDKSTSNKVELIIDALEDVINTFKTRGSPEGKELLREVLKRNRLFGGSPVPTVSQSQEVKNSYASEKSKINS